MSDKLLERLAGLGQDMVMPGTFSRAAMPGSYSQASTREIAIPSYMPARTRTRGFGDEVVQGDYHIVGTSVILRSGPSASDNPIGTLVNGEGVYAFGDTQTDDAHMVGPNGEAEPNDGNAPGIDYTHVGTQTHGAGWVAANFIAPGAGNQVNPNPAPTPQPQPQPPAPTPTPTPAPMTTSDKTSVFLVGGLIGVAVLGGIVLLVHHAKKQPRRLAHA